MRRTKKKIVRGVLLSLLMILCLTILPRSEVYGQERVPIPRIGITLEEALRKLESQGMWPYLWKYYFF
jgi:hypothetical protein